MLPPRLILTLLNICHLLCRGENGYIRLARSDDDDNNCAYDTTPQDGLACAGQTDPVKVCGTSGILYDSVYPTGAKLYSKL